MPTAAAAAVTNMASPAPPPPPPPPPKDEKPELPPTSSSSSSVTQPQDENPPSSSASSTAAATTKMVPYRPAKIRKTSASVSPSPAPKILFRPPPRPMSAEGEVAAALCHLRAADPALAAVIDAHEPPTWQSLHPPFHSLARSILYQQLAYKAAASIYSRFLSLCGGEAGVLPDVVLGLSSQQLRQIGVSERKASYLHDLAHKYQTGILSDSSVVAMDDKSLFTMLTMVKGIGAWSVHMFMIFSLHRPDVLPVGDLGVRKGVQMLYGLENLPKPSQMEQLCERWRPYRSVGAWYMWRLVEAKGTPTMASIAGVGTCFSSPGVVSPGLLGLPAPPIPASTQQMMHPQHVVVQQQQQLQHQQQRQHPQLIVPIQGYPNLG